MCSRFALAEGFDRLEGMLSVDLSVLTPRYSISPMQPVHAVIEGRQLTTFVWGLIPTWAKDPKVGYSMFSIKTESVFEKDTFRNCFKRRRCLIPASAYFVWRNEKGKAGNVRFPYGMTLKSGPFCFGGIWDEWLSEFGDEVQSCAILTTTANGLAASITDRMPVIIPEEAYDEWLNLPEGETSRLAVYFNPWPEEEMDMVRLSTLANDKWFNEPEVLEPIE